MDNVDNKKMVARIKARLLEIGQTQVWLARQAGVSGAGLSNYFGGRRTQWKADIVYRIANALDLTIGYLMFGVAPGHGVGDLIDPTDSELTKILRGLNLTHDYVELILSMRSKELTDREVNAIDLILSNAIKKE